jgi:lysosomal alpha-mannosidase
VKRSESNGWVSKFSLIGDFNRNYLLICLDRCHGGGSIHDGSVEIMVHRRIRFCDQSSIAEPLNETAFRQGLIVRGRRLLVIDSPNTSAITH